MSMLFFIKLQELRLLTSRCKHDECKCSSENSYTLQNQAINNKVPAIYDLGIHFCIKIFLSSRKKEKKSYSFLKIYRRAALFLKRIF